MLRQLRTSRASELAKVAEVIDRASWLNKTRSKVFDPTTLRSLESRLQGSVLGTDQLKNGMKAGLLTYLLHCEARIASFLGKGFYTIGPCGEELLSGAGLALAPQDLAALHYRHLATSVVRQMRDGNHDGLGGKSTAAIALDRARGFTVSSLDPVTSGRHCSIGGDMAHEFLVTSTLASQAPPAVGRALAIPLANRFLNGTGTQPNFSPDAVSYVSLGDGSLNNGHFLSALNLAQYATHSGVKCPAVFAISDNRRCISLRGNGYIDRFVNQLGGGVDRGANAVSKNGIRTVVADGTDLLDVFEKTHDVLEYSRSRAKPSLIMFNNLPRRFGHAATDRQGAYLSAAEITAAIDHDPLSDYFAKLLQIGVYTPEEIELLFNQLYNEVETAFDTAEAEEKVISRDYLVETTTRPLVTVPHQSTKPVEKDIVSNKRGGAERPDVMRKQMTRVFDEILEKDPGAVYIGEDVQHGGYYLVTDGLAAKYPMRVRDFPPDETTLVGAAMGFSQAGLTTILEIPYAKYLDCGGDMFQEAIMSNWLSNCRQPNGMVVRLQGFDKGIFGGNFHTHNTLQMPPGLDVVCFSNGKDYVRGMRYLVAQAKAGRMVMSVDCTDLLNRRHLREGDKDEVFLTTYPEDASAGETAYHFDEINVYAPRVATDATEEIVIVTYGNGVPTALIAQDELATAYPNHRVVVIESPCLSQTPAQLKDYCREKNVSAVVFADITKSGAGMPLSGHLSNLQQNRLLPSRWRIVGAAPTYNPLGTYLTFLSTEDIVNAVKDAMA